MFWGEEPFVVAFHIDGALVDQQTFLIEQETVGPDQVHVCVEITCCFVLPLIQFRLHCREVHRVFHYLEVVWHSITLGTDRVVEEVGILVFQ